MPGRDGTGPMGYEPLTGRGFGGCLRAKAALSGMGLGLGRGFGRSFVTGQAPSKTEKELLIERKRRLEAGLDAVSKRLENL